MTAEAMLRCRGPRSTAPGFWWQIIKIIHMLVVPLSALETAGRAFRPLRSFEKTCLL